ncbi:hypothetical protein SprV_0200668500 [Sparganum proliferum]
MVKPHIHKVKDAPLSDWGVRAGQSPRKPIGQPIRSATDFRQLNARLQDVDFRRQLMGGRTFDYIFKRIFYVIHKDEFSAYVNLYGRKLKDVAARLTVYEVVTKAFWLLNSNSKTTLSQLGSLFTRRLKRSLDRFAKSVQKGQAVCHSNERSEPSVG